MNTQKNNSDINIAKIKIAIVGLGYVGLPLAIEFGKKYSVVGFDTDQARIDDLKNGIDKNHLNSMFSVYMY